MYEHYDKKYCCKAKAITVLQTGVIFMKNFFVLEKINAEINNKHHVNPTININNKHY